MRYVLMQEGDLSIKDVSSKEKCRKVIAAEVVKGKGQTIKV